MSKRLRIGFINAAGAGRTNWSGTTFYMARAIERHCGELIHFPPISGGWPMLRAKLLNKFSSALLHKRYNYLHTFALARRYARHFEKQLQGTEFDVLFGCAAATELSLLTTTVPIVGSSDATAALNREYYTSVTKLLGVSDRMTDEIERLYTHKTQGLLYSSQWAADSAEKHYSVPRSRLFVAPYGANLDDDVLPDRTTALREKKKDVCRLLFLGVDWERKGGVIAVETLKNLLANGIPAELTVCGCIPPENFRHPKMRIIPFLNKNTPEGMQGIVELLLESHFLLLPTRAEAFGIVFCEASAFGLPSITTDTGGVSGVVTSGRNGYLLPPSAQGEEYASVITDCFSDSSRYEQLCRTSREEYESRLNWNAWGRAAADMLRQVL